MSKARGTCAKNTWVLEEFSVLERSSKECVGCVVRWVSWRKLVLVWALERREEVPFVKD